MAVLHDVRCPNCRELYANRMVNVDRLPVCKSCNIRTEIEYSTPRSHHLVSVHNSERSIVWRNPRNGHIAYPGRNDVPMPERYRKHGYEKHELSTLRSLDKFCSEQRVTNEKASFDNSGHADDL